MAQAEFDLDNLDALDESAPAEASASDPPAGRSLKPRQPKRHRPLWEVCMVFGGVFLSVSLLAWFLYLFIFTEGTPVESTIELPENRMETVMMELPTGKVRYEGPISKRKGTAQQTVLIVEVDASIIVFGTANELREVENLLRAYHHRVEEVMDETIRTASKADLSEPDVLTIRTRIRDRINEMFGKPAIREVIFSHFRAFHTPIKS